MNVFVCVCSIDLYRRISNGMDDFTYQILQKHTVLSALVYQNQYVCAYRA